MKKNKNFLRKFNLKDEYKKCWKFIKESRNFIFIAIMIFFLFALLGFFVPVPEIISEQIMEFIQEILEKTKGMSHKELISFIFFNNLQSGFSVMVSGILFGVLPVIMTAFNGYILGFVALISVQNGGASVLWNLVPHGIFELPAIFISFGLGMKIGSFIFQKKKMESLKKYFWDAIRVFLLVVIPLLIIAGIIEGSLIVLSS